METNEEVLSKAEKAYLIAPAGCGKTEIIVKAVSLSKKKQLVLTHTHAGVDSLRARFKKNKVSPKLYHVETIAGWALHYTSSFPKLSGLTNLQPTHTDWHKVYEAMMRLLSKTPVQEILKATYAGVFVDEYQDCTLQQHEIVCKMAEMMPCRIIGDPHQGIFGFRGEKLVNWEKDIFPYFKELSPLTTPWRWQSRNKELGDWLLNLRSQLIPGQTIDLQNNLPAGVIWKQASSYMDLVSACRSMLGSSGNVLVIGSLAARCHTLAKSLGGYFKSMDEMEAKDLFIWVKKIEDSTGPRLAAILIEFASVCMTKIVTDLKDISTTYEKGQLVSTTGRSKNIEIIDALNMVAQDQSTYNILTALILIKKRANQIKAGVHRIELWSEMIRTLTHYQTGKTSSLKESAWLVRNKTRIVGRKLPKYTVSRTLLVKGLEFDHVVITDTEALDMKNLYVAMTRPTQSLVIVSKTSKILLT